MRYATACMVCAGPLPPHARADCRYCGVRCRLRAYRIRSDGGGRLRSDAQRRDYQDVRHTLREVQQEHTHAAAEATAKLADSQEILRRTVEDRRQTKDRLAQTEQALQDLQYAAAAHQKAQQAQHVDLQARVAADSAAKQSLEQQLKEARQSIDTLSQRCTTAEQECERLRQKLNNQGDVVTLRRSDYEDLLADRAAKKRLTKQLMLATDFNQELLGEKRRLENQLADCWERLDEAAASATRTRMVSQRRADNDAAERALRGRVEQLQAALLTVEHDKSLLSRSVQDLTNQMAVAERQRSTQESTISSLRTELANAQEQLRSRQSAENTQIAIAGLQEVGKIGLGAAVALLQNRLVKEFPKESGAAAPKEPSQLERLALWQKRIPAAKARGWKAEHDPLIAAKRDELMAADQLAKLQTSLGIPPTARALPYFPSLSDLSMLEALSARSAFYRRHGGHWVIELFQLDPKSEEILRWDSVEAMADINAERIKLAGGNQ